jgi:hypothetical protein
VSAFVYSSALVCAPPHLERVVGVASALAFVCAPARVEQHTTLVDGYLGSRNDEERSEMRYVVRIAEFSESSNL